MAKINIAGLIISAAVGISIGVGAERTLNAQSPPVAYYVNETRQTDPEAIKPYVTRVPAIVEKYGGRYLARLGKIESLEGEPLKGGIVIIAFKSLADVRRWYDSPEYQEIIGIRHKYAVSRNYAVEGLPN